MKYDKETTTWVCSRADTKDIVNRATLSAFYNKYDDLAWMLNGKFTGADEQIYKLNVKYTWADTFEENRINYITINENDRRVAQNQTS